MSFSKIIATSAISLASVIGFGAVAMAADGPQPWQMGYQPSATPVMEGINDFHNMLLVMCVVIMVFVTGLLMYVMVKFNAKANPEPSARSHNTLLEVLWTAIPIMILVVMSVPSLKLLYFQDLAQNPEMTIKVTANQFYWSYAYPDQGDFEFDATRVEDEDLKEGQPRLLATDNAVVVPVNTEVRVLVAAADVIHAWAVPAFGVKMDAVPGRLNETWFKATREGTFYGQCSELCGTNHGFMPIEVKVVSKEEFAKWVVFAKKEFASAAPFEPVSEEAATRVAAVHQN